MRTIGRELDAHKSIGPGFDFLRIALALSIVCFHSATVSNHYYPLDDTPMWAVHYWLVPMFFALSGFLVSASATRLSLRNFLVNRGLRIVPALAVDTLVCALVIGPIFTHVSLRAYFAGQSFHSYFLNMIGWVHYQLPGVFESLPVARVNGSLWTVPFELLCYALISLLIVTNAIRRRFIVLAWVIVYLAASVAIANGGILQMIHSAGLRKAVSIGFIEYEAQAVTAFLLGIVAFQNRQSIPYSPALFGACVVVTIAIALLLDNAQGQSPVMRFVLMPLIVYETVFIGLTPIRLPAFFRTGDYSYGIYLYHQPFLQIVVSVFPALSIGARYGAGFTLVAAVPFVIGVAYLSWTLVEKPTLALRKRFFPAVRARDAVSRALPASTGATRGAASPVFSISYVRQARRLFRK